MSWLKGLSCHFQTLPSTDPSIPREIPSAASPSARIGPILACLALLLDGSKVRIEEYLAATDIAAVFPRPQNYKTAKQEVTLGTPIFEFVVFEISESDRQLVAAPTTSTISKSPWSIQIFPPLGTTSSAQRQRSSLVALDFMNEAQVRDSDDTIESPFISWLIYLVRTGTGFSRVMAAKVLVTLFQARVHEEVTSL